MSLFPHSFTASLDDVVFEGRHQAYGAYQLRQGYKRHLASAGGITLASCALLLLVWLAWPTASLKPLVETPGIVELISPPATVIEKRKQAVTTPPHQAHAVPTHLVATQPTQVVSEKTPLPTLKPVYATEDLVEAPVSSAGSNAARGLLEEVAGGTSDGSVADAAPVATGPYLVVEKMPEFAGGQAALLRYLQRNLRYPATALAAQAEGRVFLSFVIQADGTIADVTILKGLGYGLDEEAQRVVRHMPAWTPGYQSKHAVAVRFTLPITFKIQ